MRTHARLCIVLPVALGSALAGPGALAAQSVKGGPPPGGARVEVRTLQNAEAASRSARGELLAATPDSLWLQGDNGLASVAFREIDWVRVQRSSFGAVRALQWSLLAGLGSGLALTAACSSVEGASCGGVLPSVLVAWGIVGGLSAASIESSRFRRFDRPSEHDLRPYARFPQGLPHRYEAPGRERPREGSPRQEQPTDAPKDRAVPES